MTRSLTSNAVGYTNDRRTGMLALWSRYSYASRIGSLWPRPRSRQESACASERDEVSSGVPEVWIVNQNLSGPCCCHRTPKSLPALSVRGTTRVPASDGSATNAETAALRPRGLILG